MRKIPDVLTRSTNRGGPSSFCRRKQIYDETLQQQDDRFRPEAGYLSTFFASSIVDLI